MLFFSYSQHRCCCSCSFFSSPSPDRTNSLSLPGLDVSGGEQGACAGNNIRCLARRCGSRRGRCGSGKNWKRLLNENAHAHRENVGRRGGERGGGGFRLLRQSCQSPKYIRSTRLRRKTHTHTQIPLHAMAKHRRCQFLLWGSLRLGQATQTHSPPCVPTTFSNCTTDPGIRTKKKKHLRRDNQSQI